MDERAVVRVCNSPPPPAMHASTPPPLRDPAATYGDVRDRIGTIVADRYRVLHMIGEGGMGAVFEAEVLGSGERVAVKLIKPEYSGSAEVNGRFLQEVRAAASVGHPNIVRMLDAGTDVQGPYMVLELLKGETLCDVLERRAMGPREALTVMVATLDALQAAHRAGIVHRDIKPENIFLVGGADACRAVKLLDFGISKMLSLQSAMGGITRAGTAVGTPDYMSPEQASGARVDGRADLWSVGAVLYEAVSQEHAFEGDTYQQLISNIVLNPHKPLRERVPSTPPTFEALIDRCLQKEAADRFSSATEMLIEARRVLAALPSDESLGFRGDDPTSVLRAAPNEPTQVIDIPPVHAKGRAKPERPRAEPPPTTPNAPTVSPSVNQVPPAESRRSPPPAAIDLLSDAPTLSSAPAWSQPPEPLPPQDEPTLARHAIPAMAVLAGILVLVVLALRIRSASRDSDPTVSPPTIPSPTAPPPSVVTPPVAQPLAPAVAQPLAPSVTQALIPAAPSPAPSSTPTPPPAPRAAPPQPSPTAPRRATAPLATNVSPQVRTAATQTARTLLRVCAVRAPGYHGVVEALLTFDMRGYTRAVDLRRPSHVLVAHRCMIQQLMHVTVPAAANRSLFINLEL